MLGNTITNFTYESDKLIIDISRSTSVSLIVF